MTDARPSAHWFRYHAGYGAVGFVFERPAWMADAACARLDLAAADRDRLFFPDRGGNPRHAKKICAGCDVRDDCLRFALDQRIQHGIWGGTSERERRRLRRTL